MSAKSSPPATPGPTPGSAPGGHVNPEMRVSDAERAAAADRLSTHYGDGRLDEPALHDRLDRAMRATTQADLDGLFTDLPGGRYGDQAPGGQASGSAAPSQPPPAPDPAPAIRRNRPRRLSSQRLIAFGLVVLVAIVVGHTLAHFYFPWLMLGLLAFLWLRFGPERRRR